MYIYMYNVQNNFVPNFIGHKTIALEIKILICPKVESILLIVCYSEQYFAHVFALS